MASPNPQGGALAARHKDKPICHTTYNEPPIHIKSCCTTPLCGTSPASPQPGPASPPVQGNMAVTANESSSGSGFKIGKIGNRKDKKKKVQDIGTPTEVRQIGHIGIDSAFWVDTNDQNPAMQALFKHAVISDPQLKDKDVG